MELNEAAEWEDDHTLPEKTREKTVCHGKPTRPLRQGCIRHVFITHCQDDYVLAKTVYTKLEEEGFICGLATKNFVGGEVIFDQIIQAIDKSEKILTILSNKALRSYWCTLELSLTLERTNHENAVCIIPLIIDLEKDDLPDVLKQLKCFDIRNEDYMEHVIRTLLGPAVFVKSLLPVGNVGHGLAWSYFYSFMDIILPDLPMMVDEFKKAQIEAGEACEMPRKIYLLLPENCRFKGKVSDDDPSIEWVRNLRVNPIEKNRAGKPRKYNNSVYRIKSYYFVCEYCSVVKPLVNMEEGEIAQLTAEERRRQVVRFFYTLRDILHRAYPRIVELIRYDPTESGPELSDRLLPLIKKDIMSDHQEDLLRDPTESGPELSDRLLPLIKKDIMSDHQEDLLRGTSKNVVLPSQIKDKPISHLDNRMALSQPLDKHWDFHAFLMYGDGNKDYQLAKELCTFLQEKNLKCALKDANLTPGQSMLEEMNMLTKRSKRVILILSDETSDNIFNIFHMLRVPSFDNLLESVQPIPVLRYPRLKKKEIVDFCRNLTWIDIEEDDYKNRLIGAVEAEVKVPLLPAGEIAEGFAWSYFYGYLKSVLPEFALRITKMENYRSVQQRVSHKMILFMPESGQMEDKMVEIPGVREYCQVGLQFDRAGNVNRSYDSTMYEVTHPKTQQKWYFVGEYITPLAVMRDMEMSLVAGISTDFRQKQVTRLYQRLEEILSHEHAKSLAGTWRSFRHDDTTASSREMIACQLIDIIQQDVAEQLNKTEQSSNKTLFVISVLLAFVALVFSVLWFVVFG